MDDSSFEIPGAGRLLVCQRTVTDDAFASFRAAVDAGTIAPEPQIGRKAVKARIAATRAVLQEGLGQTAARATLYYTLPNVPNLISPAEGALENVLSVLHDQLNLPFKSTYAARLGNFEIFDLNAWLDRPQPFLIEVVGDRGIDRSGPQTMEICRTPEFACIAHTAHLVGRVHGDVVVDRLVTLAPGEYRVRVQIPEQLDQFDFRLFSADGETLLHSERSTFLNRIGFVLAPVGRQITIEDDLSGRAAQKGGALASQAATVVAHTSHRSLIGGPAQGSWRKFAEDMEDTVAAQLPKASEDKWFPRGIEGEVGAIAMPIPEPDMRRRKSSH
jgi:cytochrome c551/c552